MRYVDTSVLVAYLTPETKSEAAEAFMRSPGEPLAISTWTEVELLSALGVKVRTGQLPRAGAEAVLDAYSHLVSPQLRHLPVDDSDHRRTLLLLNGWQTALKAGDGLHLAIAANRSATIYTLDRGLAAAAKTLGLAAKLLD
ncbi:MAG: type II toxin-antitoxin system VapC family toxin [Rhodocyclaceae bacterium]|nr:type II toxin-antitoxin system VapC family toxin [Rhodocyclaceae bacterium]